VSGPYQPGSAYSLQFATSNPTTGAAQDADLPPVATAVRNGLDDPAFVLAVVHLGTGLYSASGTVPTGYGDFDSVAIRVAATVATVAGVAIVDLFVVSADGRGPTYTRTRSANFGKGGTGLTGTLGYTLYNPNGTVNAARTTAGIVECPAGSGNYVAAITFTTGFSGLLAWDTGGSSPRCAVEEVNPGADEYLDAPVSSRSVYAAAVSPALSSTAATWSALAEVYCTDEDIALRALGDYPQLCPDHQKLASGTDGVFSGAGRWTLTSATVDFANAGVHAGNVIWLKAPRSQYRNDGELLAVESVGSDGSATLRRLGKGASVGQPPAPAAGLTGVTFEVLTFDPQIDQASYEINRWYGIDATYPERTPFDARQLSLLCVLWVLELAYGLNRRKRAEDFGLKYEVVKAELDDQRSRATVQWGPQGLSARPGGVFGARAGR
jgi:hypothetical protein